MLTKAEAYKNRRVGAAVRGGFTRLRKTGTTLQIATLKIGLAKKWDKGLGKPCPLLCGKKLTAKRSAFCHNIALASGGLHRISNIFLACSSCNSAQRTLSVVEYLKLRTVVIEHMGEEIWAKVKRWLAGSRH